MAPIVTREQLVQLVSADRAAGKTVALANGCFDLLHVGHVRYLTAAAAEADRLIVAVNDDESVTALKGRWAAGSAGGGPRGARGSVSAWSTTWSSFPIERWPTC